MILRAEHRAGELAGQMRLAPSRFRSRNPMQRQLELLLELEVMKEPRLVIGGERDDQRPLAAQLNVDAGGLLELVRGCPPAGLAVPGARPPRPPPPPRFRPGRPHSRRPL